MQIEELKVEGYRSLRSVTWRPGALNVLIGPNASGKSNLLEVLELLALLPTGKLSDHIMNLGGLSALLWDNKAPRLDIEWKTRPIVFTQPERNLNEQWWSEHRISLAPLGRGGDYEIRGETHRYVFDTNENDLDSATSQNFHKVQQLTFDRLNVNLVLGSFSETDISHDPYMLEDLKISSRESILSASLPCLPWEERFNALWSSVSTFLDCHTYQNFRSDSKSEIRQPAVVRYEKNLAQDGSNLPVVLHTFCEHDKNFKESIDGAMRAAFDEFDRLTFLPASTNRIELGIQWKNASHPHAASQLSDGTLRFLYLLTILNNPAPPSVIAIDEPEVGLHPRMHAIIAEHAAQASERAQVVLVTHSPEFLDAFREVDVVPTITVFEHKDGETHLRTIAGETLAYWLQNYSQGELFRTGELEDME